MTCSTPTCLLAVHISDGVLTGPWICGGFVIAAVLAALGVWRIRDEEIPAVALLTAAFFVASLIHVRVGPTSAHLLLNGFLGVVLGTRACLAIPVGLFLQAALLAHGGFSTLGVNSCVLTLPAVAAGWLFATLRKMPGVRRGWFRAFLVFVSFTLWVACADFALGMLVGDRYGGEIGLHARFADQLRLQPVIQIAVLVLAGLGAVWAERRMENAPEFPLGLLVGTVTVLLTLGLNCLVLVFGGNDDWRSLALLLFAAHVPIVVIESLVLGFTVSFLARVKPELVGWRDSEVSEKTECPVDLLA